MPHKSIARNTAINSKFLQKMSFSEDNVSEVIDRDKMEELLYAIQNAAHTEYHLLEVHEKNHTKGDLAPFIERARETRRVLMNELMEMFEGNGVGAVWCVIKHALLTHFHLLELYEKDYEKIYIEQAQEVYLMINDLLKHEYKNYSNCARCDGDREEVKADGEQLTMILEPNTPTHDMYLTEWKTTLSDNTQYIDATFVVDQPIEHIDVDIVVDNKKEEDE